MIAADPENPNPPEAQPPPCEALHDTADDQALLAAHFDEARQSAVVRLPVATWRLVAAAVRYCAGGDGVCAVLQDGAEIMALRGAGTAIREAIAARVPDANGQTSFEDEVADDPTMADADRIHWLRVLVRGLRAEVAVVRAPADTALHAAAPDLLAACKQQLAWNDGARWTAAA